MFDNYGQGLLTSDKEILRDISGVHIPCAYSPEQHLSGLKNNIPHIPAIEMEISKMLSKGIIVKLNETYRKLKFD